MKRLTKTVFAAIAGFSTIVGSVAPLHACGGGGGGGRGRSFGYGIARAQHSAPVHHHHHHAPQYAPQYAAPQYYSQQTPACHLQPNYIPASTLPQGQPITAASYAGSLPPTVQRVAKPVAKPQGFAAAQPQGAFGGEQFATQPGNGFAQQGQPAPQQAQAGQFQQGQPVANRQPQPRQIAQGPVNGGQQSFGGQPQGGQPGVSGQAGTAAQPRRLSTQPVVQPRTIAGGQQQPQQQPQQQQHFAQQPVSGEAGALQSLGGLEDAQQFTSTPTQPEVQQPMDEAQSSALEALGGYSDEQVPAEEAGLGESAQQGFDEGSAPQAASSPIGNWSASLPNGATVELSLQEDGNFNWIAKSGEKSSSFSGSYSFESGSLTLVRSSDNQKLAGLLTPTEGQGFNFKLNGAKDSGLNFSRI